MTWRTLREAMRDFLEFLVLWICGSLVVLVVTGAIVLAGMYAVAWWCSP